MIKIGQQYQYENKMIETITSFTSNSVTTKVTKLLPDNNNRFDMHQRITIGMKSFMQYIQEGRSVLLRPIRRKNNQ